MTQPKLAHATEWGRMYGWFIGDQPRVPSITTVLAEAPDSLHGWHARKAAEAMRDCLRGGESLARWPHVVEAIENARNRNHNVERAAHKAIANTGVWLAEQASERGDRVHDYAEQVALFYLGRGTREAIDQAREHLAQHGEHAYAVQFDNWWRRWDVKPVFAEATVRNHTVGYAGTIDIGFMTNGHLVIGDYKSKESFMGNPKSLDPKVALQLVAGMHAEEFCTDPEAPGTWEPWRWSKPNHLIGLGVSDTGVDPQLVDLSNLELLWTKFKRLRELWQSHHDLDMGRVIKAMKPPPSAARWSDELLLGLDLESASELV